MLSQISRYNMEQIVINSNKMETVLHKMKFHLISNLRQIWKKTHNYK